MGMDGDGWICEYVDGWIGGWVDGCAGGLEAVGETEVTEYSGWYEAVCFNLTVSVSSPATARSLKLCGQLPS